MRSSIFIVASLVALPTPASPQDTEAEQPTLSVFSNGSIFSTGRWLPMEMLTAPPGATPPAMVVGGNGHVGLGVSAAARGARLHVEGTTRTTILEVTGGGDLAEAFELQDSADGQAGLLMCFDTEQVGAVHRCRSGADRTVVGVTSGAGGLSPAVTLSPSPSPPGALVPIALAGRAYVHAEALDRAITPGDLVTTSGRRPGYAAAADPRCECQGAIVGKAMSGLPLGEEGLVLILVSLR